MQKGTNKVAILSQMNSGNHISRLGKENIMLDLRIQFILVSRLTLFQKILFKANSIQFFSKQFPKINIIHQTGMSPILIDGLQFFGPLSYKHVFGKPLFAYICTLQVKILAAVLRYV